MLRETTHPPFIYGIAAGDFNSDGFDDIAGSFYFNPNAGIHVTQGSVNHSSPTDFYKLGTLSKEVRIADIDGDNEYNIRWDNLRENYRNDDFPFKGGFFSDITFVDNETNPDKLDKWQNKFISDLVLDLWGVNV